MARLAKPYFRGLHFSTDTRSTQGPVFTGLSAMLQNLPFLKQARFGKFLSRVDFGQNSISIGCPVNLYFRAPHRNAVVQSYSASGFAFRGNHHQMRCDNGAQAVSRQRKLVKANIRTHRRCGEILVGGWQLSYFASTFRSNSMTSLCPCAYLRVVQPSPSLALTSAPLAISNFTTSA